MHVLLLPADLLAGRRPRGAGFDQREATLLVRLGEAVAGMNFTNTPLPAADPAITGTMDIPVGSQRQPTVTVRAVLENNYRSIVEAMTLLRSLRGFGGALADSTCELHFVEELPEDTSQFERFGAVLKTVARFDERCPHANKLAMFYPVATDYLLAIDADVVISGDFSRYLVGEAVAAMPANGDWMPTGAWKELFDAADTPFPLERVMMPRFWQETIPYLNSGVIVVPRRHTRTLHDIWRARITELLDTARFRWWWGDKQRFFLDQIGLTLALGAGAFPHRALPPSMNFVLIYGDLPQELCSNELVPLLMHSCHAMNFETGHILKPPYNQCAVAVARYNALLDAESSRPAKNRRNKALAA